MSAEMPAEVAAAAADRWAVGLRVASLMVGAADFAVVAGVASGAVPAGVMAWLFWPGVMAAVIAWVAGGMHRSRAARLRQFAAREAESREKWDRGVARRDAERQAARERYDALLAELDENMRRATDLLPPAADPGEVVERLRDLDLDVTTAVAPDGVVTVTLRRRTEPAAVG